MGNILYNISQVLGITIVHSLWQGLLVYFILRVILLFWGRESAATKYLLAASGLAAISLWFFYTLAGQIYIYHWSNVNTLHPPVLQALANLPPDIGNFSGQSIRYYYSIGAFLPYISAFYLTGLLFNTVKLFADHRKIRLVKQLVTVDHDLQRKADVFAHKLGIAVGIKTGLSNLIDVPCVAGYLKPVILLPFMINSYLGAEEIEAVLLHELAHIRRNDYLLNLLQQTITALLFFNPCAQLIGRMISEERENCCDDLVLHSAPKPVVYAKALLKLEQTRTRNIGLAMAATGTKYHLLNRIERFMKTKKETQNVRPALAALAILAITVCTIAIFKPEIARGKISVKGIAPVAISNAATDTARKKAVAPRNASRGKKTVKAKSNSHEYIDMGEQYYSGYNDPELKKLSEEIGKYGDEIGKYYEEPQFKKLQEQVEAKAKEIEQFYNDPALQKLITEQKKYSDDYAKNFSETNEMKQLNREIEESGKRISKYYDGPEFKKLREETERKYGLRNQVYNTRDTAYASPRYKRFAAEIYSKIPAGIKEDQENITRLSKQMSGRYNNPEIRRMNEKLVAASDSLKMAYNDGAIRQKQAELGKLSTQLEAFQNNEAIRQKQKRLSELSKRMQAYTQSTEFKRRLDNYRKINPDSEIEKPAPPPPLPGPPEKPKEPGTDN